MRLGIRVILVLMPLLVVTGVSGETHPGEDDRRMDVYLVADGTGTTSTVFQQVRGSAGGTWQIGIPEDAGTVEVRSADGRVLEWTLAGPARLVVAVPDDVDTVHVVARALPGPAEDDVVRWGPLDARIERLVVALPAAYAPEGLPRAERSAVAATSPYGDWPLPPAHSYWMTDAAVMTEPFTVRMADAAGPDGPVPFALAAGLLVLLGATTLWLMRRVHRGSDDPTRPREMPILGHLEELRNRILWVLGVLGVGAVLFFTFGFRWVVLFGRRVPLPFPSIYDNAAAQVFSWLSRRVVPPDVQVIVVSPWDAITTQITIALALAVAVAFPVLFYHLYAFLAPALTPKERRAVFFTVPVVVVLFVIGAAFGIGLMLPFMVSVLYGFAGTLGATAFLNVPDLVALGALMGIVFGIAFELPIVMALLSGLGVVPAAAWRRLWRHALVAIALVAALVTDPTVLTQLIVAAVLFGLYLIGIGLAALFEKKVSATTDLEPPSSGRRAT